MIRILVSGSRHWHTTEHIQTVRVVLNAIKERVGDFLLIEGGARGVDTIANRVALDMGMAVMTFPARWREFGKKAGPIRNSRMLKVGKPDVLIAFHDDIANSSGTLDMYQQASHHPVGSKSWEILNQLFGRKADFCHLVKNLNDGISLIPENEK